MELIFRVGVVLISIPLAWLMVVGSSRVMAEGESASRFSGNVH